MVAARPAETLDGRRGKGQHGPQVRAAPLPMATEDKKYMEATRQPVLYYAGIMNE